MTTTKARPSMSATTFREDLLAAGILVPSGVQGLYGRNGVFEDIVQAVVRLAQRDGLTAGVEVYRFSPLLPRPDFVRTDYLRSFPDLIGSVHGFRGDDLAHSELLSVADHGGDWAEGLAATDLMLLPASCYPLYPMLTGTLPEGGRRFDVQGICFRHEPSDDPARMQSFRQHEFVYVGDSDGALAFRDHWRRRGAELMAEIGLPVQVVVANDPFFGRAGRMLAVNQRDQELKYEVVVPILSEERPTAIVSANCHLEHLTEPFDISCADGSRAQSACVGFGLERITLALLFHHGLDPSSWPTDVRERLWP